MNAAIRELFYEILMKYKNAQTIVIINDSGETHKKLLQLDEEIALCSHEFEKLWKNTSASSSTDTLT